MKVSQFIRSIISCLFLAASVASVQGFIYERSRWPKGANVVIHLGLGPTNILLQDGFTSWNASAADALAIWSGYCDFIDLTSMQAPTVAQTSGDGINSVFYSDTIFGDSFDDSTIAVTVVETTDDLAVTTEADVIVNTAFRYDSYRGPLQSDARGEIIDFHRVVVHEFGHVVGLDHQEFDPPGQSIMEPIISDLDHLGLDDVAGVRALYGAEISDLYGDFSGRVGDFLYYPVQQANNSPTSFTATGLPPGLTIDSTGVIMGIMTKPGEYNPVITAEGPIADAYGSIRITVSGLNEVPGLLAILHVDAVTLLADPIRPRLYAAGENGINMIDTDTLEVTQLVPNNQRPAKLTFSADNTLLYYRAEASTTLHRIDLNSLEEIPTLKIPLGYSPFFEGLDNRAYSCGINEVYQLDATTGAVQTSFAAGSSGSGGIPQITITPDRKTLVVQVNGVSIASYDISTALPLMLASITGNYSYPTPAADSQHIYCFSQLSQTTQPTEFPLPGFDPVSQFGVPESGSISVAPDGSIYECRVNLPGLISIFDPASLQQTGQLDITYPPFNFYEPYTVAFDSSGQFFYVGMTIGGSTEIWKFSSDFASFPPPDPIPTKNLLNISTRAKVGLGEEAMIGGFIVQGPNPKKVLVRGIGPSLPLTGALSDPIIDLYDSKGELIASNDNWTANRLSIVASHAPPTSPREAAIVRTLDPGGYTAIVRDRANQLGQALVEVYDLDPGDSLLANISTRGKVGTDDDVMIAGFIIGGLEPTEVLVRAIGPSLTGLGINQPLPDPLLELHDAQGAIIATNDNWRMTQQAEVLATGIPPSNDQESAIVTTLNPSSYTAIVRGQNRTTGVALVEVYNLGHAESERK